MNQRLVPARRGIAIVLYSLAGLGTVLGVLTAFAIRENVRRNAATGDFAGAGLGMAFLLTGVLPLTLTALLLALWLAPPRWGRRTRADAESPRADDAAPSPRARSFLAMLAAGLFVAAAALAATVLILLVGALRSAYEDHGTKSLGLIGLAIQDLIVFSPMMLLAGVLFWIAGRVARRRPE